MFSFCITILLFIIKSHVTLSWYTLKVQSYKFGGWAYSIHVIPLMPFYDDFYEIDDLLYIARYARIERGKMFPKRNRFQPFNNNRWFEERRKLFSQPLPVPSQQLGMQQERMTTTQGMYAVPKDTGPHIPIDTQETVIVPSVLVQKARKLSYPPHTTYRSTQGYLLRLYGAVQAYQNEHHHLPSALCISSRIEPMLAHEFFRFMDKPYNGRFYIVHPSGLASVKSFPVLTENDLPALLTLVLGSIDTDLVVAIGEY